MTSAAPASLPPPDLPGLDPEWSRLVTATDAVGVERTWHVLDAGPKSPVGTILCLHGNPTWSYTFRSIVAQTSDRWRVVAPDHLGMGYSERTGDVHRLSDRIDELDSLTTALHLRGPVVIVAHDWGGAISLGWALRHVPDVAGIVLLNTAVSQPSDRKVPQLIRLARSRHLLVRAAQRTQTFLRGTLRLAHPPLPTDVASAYRAPYTTADRRQAIADFVADIPLETDHPSYATLRTIAGSLDAFSHTPSLLLWGPRDPVFTDVYLRDLQTRLPHAHTHRFEGCGHLVVEDAPVAAAVREFADGLRLSALLGVNAEAASSNNGKRRTLWSRITERADDADAVVEMGRRGPTRVVSWRQLHDVVHEVAAGMSAIGVSRGDRVALLVPPSADLTAALYATWRAGAVPVVADAGLGARGLGRALRGANPGHVIGTAKGLAAARGLGLPGTRIAAGSLLPGSHALLGVDYTLQDLRRIGKSWHLPAEPTESDEAAVLFTSGATGPAKGVVYRHRQLEAQRDLIEQVFGIVGDDRLVAAFAPFALYGPALGITSVVPDMDVTSPGTLTAKALADAVEAVDATLVFAAPAALRNIVATARSLTARRRASLQSVRLLMSAGAPVPASLLRQAVSLFGECAAHTPYGMTEALPVCDVTLEQIEASGTGNGVLVGQPLAGVQVAVSPLSAAGEADAPLTDEPDVTGEVCVRAAHVMDHYDQLWVSQRASTRDSGWHRTGDVGHLDAEGRLWVEGRLAHVVTTADGPFTPVGIEQSVEQNLLVTKAAVVGVGPTGRQVVVVVVEAASLRPGVAPFEFAEELRSVTKTSIAAVLVVRSLPVDIRHNSKIDRTRISDWAAQILAGDDGARL